MSACNQEESRRAAPSLPPLRSYHVARRFGVTERTVRNWVYQGILPAYKDPPGSKIWRFDRELVEILERSRGYGKH